MNEQGYLSGTGHMSSGSTGGDDASQSQSRHFTRMKEQTPQAVEEMVWQEDKKRPKETRGSYQ